MESHRPLSERALACQLAGRENVMQCVRVGNSFLESRHCTGMQQLSYQSWQPAQQSIACKQVTGAAQRSTEILLHMLLQLQGATHSDSDCRACQELTAFASTFLDVFCESSGWHSLSVPHALITCTLHYTLCRSRATHRSGNFASGVAGGGSFER